MRFTKIICTLGPSTFTKEGITALAEKGMNIARINFSHGNAEQHGKTIQLIQEVNAERWKKNPLSPPVAILLDTKGAEVRTGDVTEPLRIKKGEEVIFSTKPLKSNDHQVIIVNHEHFAKDAAEADTILIDNGESSFKYLKTLKDGAVLARANDDASIGSRRHVNLPGADLSMPSITEKDWEDMAFGIEQGIDFIALSFIREAKEVEEVREFVKKKKSSVQLISKIETRQAVKNIEEIVRASDGIMVARGDLGAEVPFERVPVIQDDIVELCKQEGKPVIVATHMLESMIKQPMPTRAEVTDIAHAATTATDATMLSGETANGAHPIAALDAMDRVLRETESYLSKLVMMEQQGVQGEREARAEAAVNLAVSTGAKAIIVMTGSGRTAREVSRYRPRMPIFAFTHTEEIVRQLQLSFGVLPFITPFRDDPEATVVAAIETVKKTKLLSKGDPIVLVSDIKAHDLSVITIQVRKI
jgi:pyruvate kinase